MRSFNTENETLLIVANEQMTSNETNIYRPLYKEERKAILLRNEIIEWCDRAVKRIAKVNITQFLIGFDEAVKRNKSLNSIPEKISNAHVMKIKTEKVSSFKKNPCKCLTIAGS